MITVLWSEKANRWFWDLTFGPREKLVDAICETAAMPDEKAELRQAKLERLLCILRRKDWEENTPEGRAAVEAALRMVGHLPDR